MGRILTPLTVINRADQILARRAAITAEQIRSVTLEDVLS